MIRLENVNKKYRVSRDHYIVALDNINCYIDRGEFVTVIGPSGSGKSTFLALVGLIDRPTEGEIWLDGERTLKLTETNRNQFRAKRLGFVYQFPSLIPTLTVLENVLLPSILQGKYERTTPERARDLLAQVGLSERLTHFPGQLSGGEQRRVATARAIIGEPDIILADEPTGALDGESACTIMDIFRSLNRIGKTIILVTHDLSLTRFSSQIIEIEQGRLV